MDGLSGTIPFEKIEVKNRTLYRYWWHEQVSRWFRRRMGLSFLPKIAMPENLPDDIFFFNKRKDFRFPASGRQTSLFMFNTE
jgi:hypothetical protein